MFRNSAKSRYKKYLLLSVLLFSVLSLPLFFIQKMRGLAIHLFSPILKSRVLVLKKTDEGEHQKLELENHLLRLEIAKLQQALKQNVMQENLHGPIISAHVIYRDPTSWSSSLWIDVGEERSETIKKNSPVLLGRAVVGVVDYVGKKQSRVRLITDVGLKLSVRAVRGNAQNLFLQEQLNILLASLKARQDLAALSAPLVSAVEKFKSSFSEKEDWLLAKGILQGSSAPLWRNLRHTLQGIGFNYDFEDKEGPARELTSGKPLNTNFPTLPLLQVGDLLVTSGLDGIFPQGLKVAEVTKIHPLKEGSYTYDLIARPLAVNLDEIHTVSVIAPMGFDPEDI